MGDFRQDRGKRSSGFGGRDGGKSNYSGKSRSESYNRDRGPVTMHQAVCDQCGKSCEVPFRPTDGKPIYCNLCFGEKKKKGNDTKSDRFSREKFSNYKTPVKSDSANNISKGNNNELKEQLVLLNSKMDRLIRAVETMKNESFMAKNKIVKSTPALNVKKIIEKNTAVQLKKVVKKFPIAKIEKIAKKNPIVKAKKEVKRISKKKKR